MKWEDYKNQYEQGLIGISVDKNMAMSLMDKRNKYVHKMFSSRRKAYSLWLNIAILCTLGALVSGAMWFVSDMVNGRLPVGLIMASLMISVGVRKNASRFIIEETLENKEYYDMIREEELHNGTHILLINERGI